MVFAFWSHQKSGLGASERNKDASHAPTARKLTLDAFHAIRVAAFLARAPPNQVLETKLREEEREERKKKKKEGERGERKKRRQKTSHLNGPSAARAYELCSYQKESSKGRKSHGKKERINERLKTEQKKERNRKTNKQSSKSKKTKINNKEIKT